MKRSFDILGASVGLVVLSPLLLVTAMLIKAYDFGPVFYRQERVGRFGKRFKILKFRTMIRNADKKGSLVTKDRDPRITFVGRFLRKTKLDELPQLWNVLTGEMSFVGPRPEVPRYVAHYTNEQHQILEFAPGITDWATLLFRNEEELLKSADDVEEFYIRYCIPKKLELNFQYARRATFLSDLRIIIQTVVPCWVLVICFYAAILSISGFVVDFGGLGGIVPRIARGQVGMQWPSLIGIQLLFLLWNGQARELLSYIGAVEVGNLAARLLGAALVGATLWVASDGVLLPPGSVIFTDLFVAFGLIILARFMLRQTRDYCLMGPHLSGLTVPRRVIIIGANDLAGGFIHDQTISNRNPFRVVGLFDQNPLLWHRRIHGVEIVGMAEQAISEEWKAKFDEAVLALDENDEYSKGIVGVFRRHGVRVCRLMNGLVEVKDRP